MILITLFYYLILKTDGYGIVMTESQFEVERALEDVPMLSSEDSESVLGLTIWTPSATGVKSPDE